MLKLLLTNRCNLNCRYCYEGSKKTNTLNDIKGKKAIDFYFDLLIKEYENIGFIPIVYHGGEPLLEFSLMKELTEYANEKLCKLNNKKVKNCAFSFTTNGILLNEKMYDFFIKNNFDISISIDGKQKTHDLNRVDYSNNGSFTKVFFNANELKKVLGNKLKVRMTVTPDTIADLSQNVSWFIEEGFTNIGIVLDYFADWTGKLESIEEEFRKLQNIYITYRKNNKEFIVDIFDGKIKSYLVKEAPAYCNAGYGSITVDADGEIYPCVYGINEQMAIGNVYKGINYKEYSKKIAEALSKDEQRISNCVNCEIQYFCHAKKCGFLNHATTGFLNVSNEIVCYQEKILFPIIKEIVEIFNIGSAESVKG
ncbi:MAG: radical SAM protein [Lachnospiraceae bacterium]|nr:radical SAM protein [Lachnospiraceae bacterium]